MSEQPELAPMTRIAAYAVVVDEAQQLLMVRIAPGYPSVGMWTLPGGGIQFGEDPALAVHRELEEETGLTGEIERLAFVGSWTRGPIPERGWGPFHGIQIVYLMRITGGSIRHEVEESTDMAAWVPLSEVRELPIVPLLAPTLEYLEASEVALAD